MDRIKAPRLILIGSSGRNSGKTTLAIALIRRLRGQNIIGLKITSVEKQGALCPRGGEGCGACAIDRPFVLCEETQTDSGKDTAELLAAGAKKVFWLRCLKESLQEAFVEFQKMIDGEALIICESNSLSLSIEPALFIMLHNAASEMKDSAKKAAPFADITLQSPFTQADIENVCAIWTKKIKN
jgi:DNA polymerase III delta prime subunit